MNVLAGCEGSETAARTLISQDQKLLWVIPQDAAGFGDISCALKIANFLVDKGYFNRENITIVSTKAEIISIFNTYSFKVILPEDAQKIEVTSPADLLKLVVPIRSYDNINPALLQGEVSYIVLWEYGVKHREVPLEISGAPHYVGSLGIEGDEEGILIDQEMNNCSNVSWRERLRHLEKITIELRSAILGSGELEKATFEFENSSRLYFGYASQKEYFTKFLKAIVNYNHGNNKNLTYVFPVSEDKFCCPKNLKDVASVEIFVFDRASQTVNLKEVKVFSDEGKKVKVILGPLSSDDLKWVQLASRRETMVTGDQSLSQAISAIFFRFIYEALPHKAELANSLGGLYPLSPSLGVNQGEALKAKNMLRYFEQCKEKKNEFSEMSRYICVNRNAFTKIVSLIDSALF